LISWIQSAPLGTLVAGVGMQGWNAGLRMREK
jgi:hypothetical protein